MFEQRMNEYKNSVHPVEYYRQYIHDESVATGGGCEQLMLFKHGFSIRGQLEQGNTLSLAVLVQWLRQTPENKGLHFKNVSDKMLKIIQACHLQDDLKLI